MQTNKHAEQAVSEIIKTLMDKVMERVLVTDPFVAESHHATKPLYAALVPDEIFKGSHFERRFVTPFGHVWEKLAVSVANQYHGCCLHEETISGTVGIESLKRIQEVLAKLEHKDKGSARLEPNWKEELEYVKAGGGAPIPTKVTCDILIKSKVTNKSYAFELKAPLPNSDQCKVSKEKLFKLYCMNEKPINDAYYALVYNPYGQLKSDYKWSFAQRWFDTNNDECVLIGEEFWDFIGGKGIYKSFISEINKLGIQYKERIYREFLGLEPPIDFDKQLLL